MVLVIKKILFNFILSVSIDLKCLYNSSSYQQGLNCSCVGRAPAENVVPYGNESMLLLFKIWLRSKKCWPNKDKSQILSSGHQAR